MRFDTKIVVAIRDDLPTWRKLNVTAFLASGIAGVGEVMGKPYEDASGNRYLEMFRQPVVITTGGGEAIAAAHRRALARGMPVVIFTEEMLATKNDDDNRAVVRAVAADELNLVGLAAYGPRNAIDKVFKGLSLHP